MTEETSPRLQPLSWWFASMEEVAFIAGSFGPLCPTGSFPSHVCWGDASEEVQVVHVGRLQATSDQAAGVVQRWV